MATNRVRITFPDGNQIEFFADADLPEVINDRIALRIQDGLPFTAFCMQERTAVTVSAHVLSQAICTVRPE